MDETPDPIHILKNPPIALNAEQERALNAVIQLYEMYQLSKKPEEEPSSIEMQSRSLSSGDQGPSTEAHHDPVTGNEVPGLPKSYMTLQDVLSASKNPIALSPGGSIYAVAPVLEGCSAGVRMNTEETVTEAESVLSYDWLSIPMSDHDTQMTTPDTEDEKCNVPTSRRTPITSNTPDYDPLGNPQPSPLPSWDRPFTEEQIRNENDHPSAKYDAFDEDAIMWAVSTPDSGTGRVQGVREYPKPIKEQRDPYGYPAKLKHNPSVWENLSDGSRASNPITEGIENQLAAETEQPSCYPMGRLKQAASLWGLLPASGTADVASESIKINMAAQSHHPSRYGKHKRTQHTSVWGDPATDDPSTTTTRAHRIRTTVEVQHPDRTPEKIIAKEASIWDNLPRNSVYNPASNRNQEFLAYNRRYPFDRVPRRRRKKIPRAIGDSDPTGAAATEVNIDEPAAEIQYPPDPPQSPEIDTSPRSVHTGDVASEGSIKADEDEKKPKKKTAADCSSSPVLIDRVSLPTYNIPDNLIHENLSDFSSNESTISMADLPPTDGSWDDIAAGGQYTSDWVRSVIEPDSILGQLFAEYGLESTVAAAQRLTK